MIDVPDAICRCDHAAWQHRPNDGRGGNPGPCDEAGCDCEGFVTTAEWNRRQRAREEHHGR